MYADTVQIFIVKTCTWTLIRGTQQEGREGEKKYEEKEIVEAENSKTKQPINAFIWLG
jgi:hypothetical protein